MVKNRNPYWDGPQAAAPHPDEKKYCPKCRAYVRYLSSVRRGYCLVCDTPVSLFSPEDERRFKEEVRRGRW